MGNLACHIRHAKLSDFESIADLTITDWMLARTTGLYQRKLEQVKKFLEVRLNNGQQSVFVAIQLYGRITGYISVDWSSNPEEKLRGQVTEFLVGPMPFSAAAAEKLVEAAKREAFQRGCDELLLIPHDSKYKSKNLLLEPVRQPLRVGALAAAI